VDDRLSRLESRVDELGRRISEIERHIAGAERVAILSPPPAAPPASEANLAAAVSLAGRTLLALGGAYLLRAFTESGFLPPIAGMSLAALYAAVWLIFADRAGSRGKPTSAFFHLVAAALVAYPLLWETTIRLHLLDPRPAAAALAAFTLAILAVARRRGLESGAWVGVVAAEVTAAALLFGTRAVAPFAAALVICGVAVFALWGSRSARALTWVSAAGADFAVAVLLVGAGIENAGISAAAATVVPLLLFAGYMGLIVRRGLSEERGARALEYVQGSAATLLGYCAASILARGDPASRYVFLAVGVFFALFLYRAGKDFLLPGLGLLVVLSATGVLTSRPDWVWVILAALFFGAGRYLTSFALSLHGAICLSAAAVTSGLLQSALWALAAPPGARWPPLSLAGLAVTGAGVASFIAGAPGIAGAPSGERRRWAGLPGVLTLLVALLGGTAGAMLLLAPMASLAEGVVDPGRLAALRTAVLASGAVGLAVLSSRAKRIEALWLSHALLVLGGMKLVMEDFSRGRAETLFLGLAFYGAALVLAPRLRESTRH
jgi:hypothetical protein